jgi:Putative zinc- or iron-chelating domain
MPNDDRPHDNRANKRRRQRDLTKRGDALLKSGMPKSPARADLEATAYVLAQSIDDPSTAAGEIQAAFDAAAKLHAPLGKLACKKGCGYCCYGIVMISAPEAFLLATWVQSRGAEAIERFRSAAAEPAGKTPQQRHGAKLPCPLLHDGACSAYATRPVACRTVTSFDLAPCLDEFEGRGGDILVPTHYTAHGGNAQIALAAALTLKGRPVAYYELSAAVLRVLDTPDAVGRWNAGEDIFAGVLLDGDGVAGIASAARSIATAIAL